MRMWKPSWWLSWVVRKAAQIAMNLDLGELFLMGDLGVEVVGEKIILQQPLG